MKRSAPSPTSLDVWQQLLDPSCEELLMEVGRGRPEDVSFLRRLRRDWSAELVHAAIELTNARARAREKFPDKSHLLADVAGLEQATSGLIADHKAQRFSRLQPNRIVDLCCGIGGDAMSLQRIAPVLGIDRDPIKCWMTRHNANCKTQCADVESIEFSGECFHLDPSRRATDAGGTRRLWRFEHYQPGPEFLGALLDACPDGAVKLGPGVDVESLPSPAQREIEFISQRGTLTEAVLWTGRLAFHPGERTATRLPDGVTFTGTPIPIPVSTIDRFLFSVDPAIERGDLLGALAMKLGIEAIHPRLGLLTAETPIVSPWLTTFEVCTEMPLRKNKISAWLKAHDAGIVEVKTRGKAVDPDQWQAELRGDGDRPYTVFLLRFDTALRAIICRRVNK